MSPSVQQTPAAEPDIRLIASSNQRGTPRRQASSLTMERRSTTRTQVCVWPHPETGRTVERWPNTHRVREATAQGGSRCHTPPNARDVRSGSAPLWRPPSLWPWPWPMPRLPRRHHRANDEITDAVIVPGVPYTHTIDTTEATEAIDAGGDRSGAATVWYSRRGGNPTPQRRANT